MRSATRGRSSPRRSTRRRPCASSRTGAVAIGGPILLPGCTAASTAASSSPRSRRRARASRLHRLPHAADPRVPERRLFAPASIRPTRAMPAPARSWARTRSGRPVRFGQVYDPRTTRVVDGRGDARSVPEQPFRGALWDAVAGNTLEQGLWDAPELDRLLNNQPTLAVCCPVFDQNNYAVKIDQVIGSANTRCRSTSIASGGRATTHRPDATARRLVSRPISISCRTRRAG